jgi:hypothetical protein
MIDTTPISVQTTTMPKRKWRRMCCLVALAPVLAVLLSAGATTVAGARSDPSTAAAEVDRMFAPLPASMQSRYLTATETLPNNVGALRAEARSQQVVDVLEADDVSRVRLYAGAVTVAVVLERMPFEHIAAVALGTWAHSPEKTRVPGLAHVPGAVAVRPAKPNGQLSPAVVFRRGRYYVTVEVTGNPGDDMRTLDHVALDFATRQAAFLPPGPSTPYFFPSTTRAVFIALALTTAVCLFAIGLGRLRARRHRHRLAVPEAVSGAGPDARIADVSAVAAHLRRSGLWLLAAQILAIDVLVLGVLGLFRVFASFPDWASVLLIAGGLLGGIVITRRQQRREHKALGSATAGWRPTRPAPRGVAVGAVALVALIGGFALLAFGAADLAFGPSLRTLELSLSADTAPNNVSVVLALLGVVLIVAGGMAFRLARMWARAGAQQLRTRDQRPAILYLRSFEDDRLSLPTVWSARRPFLELFRLRGSEPFEEAVAWELEPYGPVVAVGRPGRSLASLGAAREYLPQERWRDEVAERMATAHAIVITLGDTEGLAWELGQIITAQHLSKTIFVFPPMTREALLHRWTFMDRVLTTAGVDPIRLPVDPASAFTATFDPVGGWSVTVADVRDESTYRGALDQSMRWLTTGELASSSSTFDTRA